MGIELRRPEVPVRATLWGLRVGLPLVGPVTGAGFVPTGSSPEMTVIGPMLPTW